MQSSGDVTFIAREVTGASRAVRIWGMSSVAAVAFVVVGLAIVTYIKSSIVDGLRTYEHKLRTEVGLLDQLRGQKQSLEEAGVTLAKRIHKVKRCSNPALSSPYLFLKEVANLTPAGVNLQTFASTTQTVTVSGQAQGMRQLTKFMHELGKSRLFAEPKLTSVQSDHAVGRVAFEIRLLKGAL